MTRQGEEAPGFGKPTVSALSRMPKDEVVQFVAASVGRLSNLYPHWLLLNIEKPLGVSPSRFIVLWLLRSGQQLSMGQIAQAIDLTPRGVSRIVDGLEEDGLAKRIEGEHDKRVKYVELTKKGRRFIDGAMPQALTAFAGVFDVLEKSEMVELIRLLENLTDHIKSEIDSHPSGSLSKRV